MNKAASFAWWFVIMILTGGIWYFMQWWFLAAIMLTELALQTIFWIYVNRQLMKKGFNWRYKFSFYNHLCFFEEYHGLDFYWLEKPTPKDRAQLRRRQDEALAKRIRA